MKTKTLNNKINSYINLINSFHRKYEISVAGQNTEKLNTLETDLEAVLALQKDVQTLKDSLKTKKKELETGIEKLKQDKSEFKKALKSFKKSARIARGKNKNQDSESLRKETFVPLPKRNPGNKPVPSLVRLLIPQSCDRI